MLEQGRRRGQRTSTLMALADALDVEVGDLCGKRERLGTDRDGGSVLAIRDAILTPRLLPGLDADGSQFCGLWRGDEVQRKSTSARP
ncbi:hypothetical protein [Actinomadura sp. 3N407]|uniref:hypothetical protein n=1 Tax=Actinomadura sp. 3N407 TaxID=3457423 RepID=UPI003FCCA3F7